MNNRDLTIEDIKSYVMFYLGEPASTQEAKEIKAIADFNYNTPIGEIIEEYYSCDY